MTAFSATPDEAIATIRAHDGPVIVDFDLTLYRRVSTADFVAAASPRLMARVVTRVADRTATDARLRDGRRVRALTTLMPWVRRRWNERAADLARDAHNERLLDAVLAGPTSRPVVVATLGFDVIVAPMVDALFAAAPSVPVEVVALTMTAPTRRLDGKLAMVRDAIGAAAIAESLLVTDSLDDRDLLEAVARPLLVEWPESRPPSTHGPLG